MYLSKTVRNSFTISSPQKFVTIQIRNQNQKKKYIRHRNSVIHQISATQSILNQSLNKNVVLRKGSFAKEQKQKNVLKQLEMSKFGKYFMQKEKLQKQNLQISKKQEKKYRIGNQLDKKLKQLTNISHHFQKACQTKFYLRKNICQTQCDDLLPTLDENEISLLIKKNFQQSKIKGSWRKKLKNGRSIIKKIKDSVNYQKPKQSQIQQQQQVGKIKQVDFKRGSLRQLYLKETRLQRKTAPVERSGSNNFYKNFCNNRQSKQFRRYEGNIQMQSVIKLQQFVSGGLKSQFNQYDNCINIKQFINYQQRFNVLKKIYSHVKDTHGVKLKDISLQTIKQSNLLALVYYIENSNNLTQLQKKKMRKQLNFVD